MADELPFDYPPDPAEPVARSTVTPRRCARHDWEWAAWLIVPQADGSERVEPDRERGQKCARCNHPQDPAKVRQGRNSRSRGNRHELDVERTYGPRKIGPLGGPADNLGRLTKWQVKTHQGPVPRSFQDPFTKLSAMADGRVSVVIHRYLRPGLKPLDYVILEGSGWLELHGKDEPE